MNRDAISVAAAGKICKLKLWRVAAALGLAIGAEHPSIEPDVDAMLRGGLVVGGRPAAQVAVAEQLLRGITSEHVDHAAHESERPPSTASGSTLFSTTPPTVRTMSSSSTGQLASSSMATSALSFGGVYDLLAGNLPPAGEFTSLPGSAIGHVLVQKDEFPFCADIACFKAKNAFLAWVGMAFDEHRGRWWNPAGGGHADYGGNEIYQFDFQSLTWTRLTDPSPLTGAFLTDLDKDGTLDACPSPTSGPPATHSYDGSLYVPSKDEVLVAGTVPYCQEAMGKAAVFWVWSNATGAWRQLTSMESTRFMRTAYDAARDRVYMIGGDGQGTFYELDPQSDYSLVRKGPYVGWSCNGVAQFDESSRYLYYTAAKIGIFRLHIGREGTIGAQEEIVAWDNKESLAFAIHRPSGHIVTWPAMAKFFASIQTRALPGT